MIEPATAWGVSVGRLPSELLSLAITGDDERIVAACEEHTAVWATRHGSLLSTLPGARAVELLGDTTQPDRVALAGAGVQVVLLDGGARPLELEQGKLASAPMAASSDGRWLAAAARTEVLIWEIASGRLVQRISADTGAPVAAMAWLSDLRLLLARRPTSRSIECWSLDGAPRLERLVRDDLSDHPLLACSPDGSRFVGGAREEGKLLLFDGAGRLVAPVRAMGDTLSARFSPDGQRLALRTRQSVSLWRAADGAPLAAVELAAESNQEASAFLNRRGALLLGEGDSYRFVDLETGWWARPAAGPDALTRDAEALAEGLALSETHEADYRTAATGAAEQQADGAWCFATMEGGIKLRARLRDGEAGTIHLVLRAHAGGTLGDWADEHHVYAADLSWARELLDLPAGASFSVLRGFRRLALEVGLDCAPPPDLVRGWLGALGARCRALG